MKILKRNPGWTPSLKIILAIVILIIVSLACNKPAGTQTDQDVDGTAFVATSVARTMAAMDSDSVPDDPSDGDGQETSTPTETPEPEPPTLTPTVTDTPTPDLAMIYASSNTNCRTGQGTSFPWLVTIQEGETVEAVGVDTSGDYWYVRRPDNPSQLCWMWGKYATPQGPWSSLPVYTPIPTPTPGFDYKLTFVDVTHCVGNSYVQFQIDNTGSFTLESWKSSGTDNSGGIGNLVIEEDDFFYHAGCPETQTQADLEPGEGSYLNVTFFADPTGNDLSVRIKVCTEDGLNGECLKKEFDITP